MALPRLRVIPLNRPMDSILPLNNRMANLLLANRLMVNRLQINTLLKDIPLNSKRMVRHPQHSTVNQHILLSSPHTVLQLHRQANMVNQHILHNSQVMANLPHRNNMDPQLLDTEHHLLSNMEHPNNTAHHNHTFNPLLHL